MIIFSNECAFDGRIIATTINNGDGTGTRTVFDENGDTVSVTILTGLPVFSYEPLDSTGALATLLVVEGVLPLQDAANAIQEAPEHLVAEAEAWSLG